MNKKKYKDWIKVYWLGAMIQILVVCMCPFCMNCADMAYPRILNLLCIAVGGTSSAVWGSIVAKKSGIVASYRQILVQFFQVKQLMRHYVMVFAFLIVLFGKALFAGNLLDGINGYSFVTIFLTAIIFGGIEEIGWRYTFQPSMEKRLPYEVASMLTFLSWGLWHYMYFYIADSLEGIQHGSFLLGLLTSCFVLGAIYHVSNSLWLCVLYHCLFNTFSQTLVANEMLWNYVSNILCTVLAIFIVRIYDRGSERNSCYITK